MLPEHIIIVSVDLEQRLEFVYVVPQREDALEVTLSSELLF